MLKIMTNMWKKVFHVTERLILCLAAEVRSRQLWMGAKAAQVWQESMLRINHHSFSSHVFNWTSLRNPFSSLSPLLWTSCAALQSATKAVDTQALTPVGHFSSPDIRVETITGHCPTLGIVPRATRTRKLAPEANVHVISVGQCSPFHFLFPQNRRQKLTHIIKQFIYFLKKKKIKIG